SAAGMKSLLPAAAAGITWLKSSAIDTSQASQPARIHPTFRHLAVDFLTAVASLKWTGRPVNRQEPAPICLQGERVRFTVTKSFYSQRNEERFLTRQDPRLTLFRRSVANLAGAIVESRRAGPTQQ